MPSIHSIPASVTKRAGWLVSAVPQRIWLSEHKLLVFGMAALVQLHQQLINPFRQSEMRGGVVRTR